MAGNCRQTFNFVLSWEHWEPLLFMVPVRWKEGREEGRACPWVEVGKPVEPPRKQGQPSSQGCLRSNHTDTDQQGGTEREREKRKKGQRGKETE